MPSSERYQSDADCVSAISSLRSGSLVPDPNYDSARDPCHVVFAPPMEIIVTAESEVPDWLRMQEGERPLGPSLDRALSAPLRTPAPQSEHVVDERNRQCSWDSRYNVTRMTLLDPPLCDDIPMFWNPVPSTEKSMMTVETIAALGSSMSDEEDENVGITITRERRVSLAKLFWLFRGSQRTVRLRRSRGCFT
jgi:hypothetical protein